MSSLVARRLRSAMGVSILATLAACGGQVSPQTNLSPAGAASSPPSAASPAPAITLGTTPNTVVVGRAVTLNWRAADAQNCTASGGWSGTQPTSGSQTTSPLTNTTKYTLTCTGAGGSASQSATVTVSSAPVTSPPPSVSLSASPTSVASGGSSTLTWSSTDATACTALDGWSGSLATSGTQSMDAITATKTYTLSCTGTGGSAAQSATVTVTSGAPTVGTVSRPSYNTGDGFFVLNGKLYDPNGNEFRIRCGNRNHYESNSSAGIVQPAPYGLADHAGIDGGVQSPRLRRGRLQRVDGGEHRGGDGHGCRHAGDQASRNPQARGHPARRHHGRRGQPALQQVERQDETG